MEWGGVALPFPLDAICQEDVVHVSVPDELGAVWFNCHSAPAALAAAKVATFTGISLFAKHENKVRLMPTPVGLGRIVSDK
eukprot:2727053-Rhodomonas_salina.1